MDFALFIENRNLPKCCHKVESIQLSKMSLEGRCDGHCNLILKNTIDSSNWLI